MNSHGTTKFNKLESSFINSCKLYYSPSEFQAICRSQLDSFLMDYRDSGGIDSLRNAADYFNLLVASFTEETGQKENEVCVGRFSGAHCADVFAEVSVYLRGDLVCLKGVNDIEMTHEEARQLGERILVASESVQSKTNLVG